MIVTSISPSYDIDIFTMTRDSSTGFVNRVIWNLNASYIKPSSGIGTTDVAGDESNSIIHFDQSRHELLFEREYDDNGNIIPLPIDFIPYENLTKEIVIQWILNCISEERMITLKKNLENKIISKLQPKVLNGIPW